MARPCDWKERISIPINYKSPPTSEDEFGEADVEVRQGGAQASGQERSGAYLLLEQGDGAPADLLGSTPPRVRIRDKEKRRSNMDSELTLGKLLKANRRYTVDNVYHDDQDLAPEVPERVKKRSSLVRSRERDVKLEMETLGRAHRADSLPSPSLEPAPAPATFIKPDAPTLVESCSRFMSLASRLKCQRDTAEEGGASETEVEERRAGDRDGLPASRVAFHKTFSMLIRMGNIDKNCKRTISVEEQVWQNEVKDLIWLELRARIAGRSLQEQDQFLCAQRDLVPAVIHNILNYRFVDRRPCKARGGKFTLFAGVSGGVFEESGGEQSSSDIPLDTISELPATDRSARAARDVAEEDASTRGESEVEEGEEGECLRFECEACSERVGACMREVRQLLDWLRHAESLYPSGKAMAAHHPVIAQPPFTSRLKALCLWYNMSWHMRSKLLGLRRLIRLVQAKQAAEPTPSAAPHPAPNTPTDAHDRSEQGCESERQCAVRFTLDKDSAGSSHSSASDGSDTSPALDTASPPSPPSEEGEAAARGHVSLGVGREEVGGSVESGYGSNQAVRRPSRARAGPAHGVAGPSAPCEAPAEAYDVFSLGPLDEVATLTLLGNCKQSPYRCYHSDLLKTQGVRKVMRFIDKMRTHILKKVYLTFEKNSSSQAQRYEAEPANGHGLFADADVVEDEKSFKERYEDAKNVLELRRYGCWSEESLSMGLPSYRSTFLLLSTICMEVMLDYLNMRLETQPSSPSALTVKQLIHELKEGLDIATEQRGAFVRNVDTALAGHDRAGHAKRAFVRVVHAYDATVENVLKQYLSYLKTMSEVEHMGRSVLEAEWAFTARLAKRMKCAAALAPLSFAEIMCKQIGRLEARFRDKFAQLLKGEELYAAADDKKQFLYALCREAQAVYSCEREPLMQTAHFSRQLAARLAAIPHYRHCTHNIFEALMSSQQCIAEHVRLTYAKTEAKALEEDPHGLLARVREVLLQGFKLGFELYRELYKFVGGERWREGRSGRGARRRPASLQPARSRREGGAAGPALPRRPGTVLLHPSYNPYAAYNKELYRLAEASAGRAGAGTSTARRPAASSPQAPTPAPTPAPPPAKIRPIFARSDSVGGDQYDMAVFDEFQHSSASIDAGFPDMAFEGEVDHESLKKNSFACAISEAKVDNLPVCPADGSDGASCQLDASDSNCPADGTGGSCPADGSKDALAEEMTQRVARAIVDFAKDWMKFVMERCERGRGLRPRWANQGLEFLMLACDPNITRHLGDEEFEKLTGDMDRCISHVVGVLPTSPVLAGGTPKSAPPSPGTPPATARAYRDKTPTPPLHSSHRSKEPNTVSSPCTPPNDDMVIKFHTKAELVHGRAVAAAALAVDRARDEVLRARRCVGRAVEGAGPAAEHKLRQVTFRWQRGLKIGAGSFGKVYTVVNTESGQLLAMKEVGVGAVGGGRALHRAANELRVLEGIVHPHLVRYYGCELHREEMLIFMELCVEGSLEALVSTGGALPEPAVRRYTKQLLSAVAELHRRSIAHRDIKSGNIFLTNEGHCLKLGDFGCAVKIRANSTAAGELQGYVGTQAYMAPEVFMKSSGHGRSADIWSLGCVVTEMASGKRPFSEYDSNYQIMFVVGMGGRAELPAALSAEGRDFCVRCLTHDPDARPAAADLLTHSFLMMKNDEDCNCEPGYFRTKSPEKL